MQEVSSEISQSDDTVSDLSQNLTSTTQPTSISYKDCVQYLNPYGATEEKTICRLEKACSEPYCTVKKDGPVTVSLRSLNSTAVAITSVSHCATRNESGGKVLQIKLSIKPQKSKTQCPPNCEEGVAPGKSKPLTKPPEVFIPGRCKCKDHVRPPTFKNDPVMAIMDTCDEEMRPVRKALESLQQQIRNLDLPELKGCFCTLALNNNLPKPEVLDTATTSSAEEPSPTEQTQIPRTKCPFFQPARLGPAPMPYGYLPPPELPPFPQYLAPRPDYVRGKGCEQLCRCSLKKKSESENCAKECCPTISCQDQPDELTLQARNYGMYPDFRGRTYPDEMKAYFDTDNKPQCKNKARQLERSKSPFSNNFDCEGSSHRYGQNVNQKYRIKSPKQSSISKPYSACSGISSDFTKRMLSTKDNSDESCLKYGQAVKSDPDEILMPGCVISRRSQGTTCDAAKSSKSKNKIKIFSG